MKILFITEQFSGVKNGASQRDRILLETLERSHTVTVKEFQYRRRKKHLFQREKKLPADIIILLNSTNFDYVIVSTMPFSPHYLSYAAENKEVIYYLCDSMFHISQQYLNFKTQVIGMIAKYKERSLLKRNKAIYLGPDEVAAIPSNLSKNALIVPFHIQVKKSLFNPEGHLLFVGDYNFLPNRRAAEQIISWAYLSDLNYELVGPNLNLGRTKIPKNVRYIGSVDKIENVYANARALIYPISYGTGVKNKVIEAMSYGIPVIGTKYAFTNLDYSPTKILKTEEYVGDSFFFDLREESIRSQDFVRKELQIQRSIEALQKVFT